MISPPRPVIRPTIVRSAAVPPPTGVITRWPGTFYVPVQLSDARMTFYAAYFVDYNPITGEGYQDTIASFPSPGDTRPVRTLPISITEPARDGCHTVEVVVARELLPTISGDALRPHAELSERRRQHHVVLQPERASLRLPRRRRWAPAGRGRARRERRRRALKRGGALVLGLAIAAACTPSSRCRSRTRP